MRLKVYFRSDLVAEGVSNGDQVQWSGKKADQVSRISETYSRGGFIGDNLLQRMNDRMQGNWWTELVEDTPRHSLRSKHRKSIEPQEHEEYIPIDTPQNIITQQEIRPQPIQHEEIEPSKAPSAKLNNYRRPQTEEPVEDTPKRDPYYEPPKEDIPKKRQVTQQPTSKDNTRVDLNRNIPLADSGHRDDIVNRVANVDAGEEFYKVFKSPSGRVPSTPEERYGIKEQIDRHKVAIGNKVSELLASGKSHGDPYFDKIDRLQKLIDENIARSNELRMVAVDHIMEHIGTPKGDRFTTHPESQFSDFNRESVVKAFRSINRLVTTTGAIRPPQVKFMTLPDDTPLRAHKKGDTIYLRKNSNHTSVVHEMGHELENNIDGLKTAAKGFLDKRCGSEKPARLVELFPNHSYRTDEYGRKDDFEKLFGKGPHSYYVGKVYKTGDTEIVSMGIQKILTDPIGFAQIDPEYFRFILDVMKGDFHRHIPSKRAT